MKPRLVVYSLAFLAFIAIGLPDGLVGVAWPSIRSQFGLPVGTLGFLLFFYTVGYLLSSFSSGRLLAGISLGSLLALGYLTTGAALLGYVFTPWWSLMVMLGLFAGIGIGAIDAGLNTYAAKNFDSRTVNWLHAFYGIGAAGGPLIMTPLLAIGLPWQYGYAIVGSAQLVLAFCFRLTLQHWITPENERPSGQASARISILQTVRLPEVRFSIAIFFIYTGLEAAAGVWAFTLFTEGRGIPIRTAGMWVSVYWGSLTGGRLLSGFLTGYLRNHDLLKFSIPGIVAGAALLWLDPVRLIGFVGLAMIGLFCAPVFPTLISNTPRRVGDIHTANSIGFQVAAAVLGQSLLPALIGVLAGHIGLMIIAPSLFGVSVTLLAIYVTQGSKVH